MSKKFFPIVGRQLFDGGLNNKYAPSIIENNESPSCLNVVFNAGAVETRQGISKINTTSVGSFPCDGLYVYVNNQGAQSMCAFFGGQAYTLSGTTLFTVPSAGSIFTGGVRVASAQDENYIFFSNGLANPYKFNGAFTRHGVPPPTQTLAVASGGVGNLTGGAGYIYTYSYVNTNVVEGNVGPVTPTFTISATSGQNTISNFATAPVSYGVNNIYLYRTKANSLTPFFRVTTMTNGTASVVDNVADSALALQGPTDNGLPPSYTSICYAQSRLFCNDSTNQNRLWYSNLGNPYVFSAQGFVTVGDNTSDILRSVSYYNNSIIMFCDRSIWFLYLTDSTPGNWVGPIRSNSSYGSKSPYGVVTYNNKLLFPAIQEQIFVGFGAFSGNVLDTSRTFLTVSTAGSDLKSDRIENDMYSVQSAYIQNISSIVYKKKVWIAVTWGTGKTTNNRVYQMDFSMSNIKKDQEVSWCPFDGMHPSQFAIYNGNLYFGTADASGFIYQCETGQYADDGAAINSYFWTKEFVGQESDVEGSDTSLFKDFRYVNLLVDNSGNYSMNFVYLLDSIIGSGNTITVSLAPGGTTWGGAMVWGTSLWGGGANQTEQRIFLQNARGRRIQMRFDNQNVGGQKFKVHGMNFLYNIKGYR